MAVRILLLGTFSEIAVLMLRHESDFGESE